MRARLDAADTFSDSVDCKADVAIFAPIGSPRVLHDPVLSAVLLAISDHEDSVINIATTSLLVENSRLIVHDVGIDGHREWTMLGKCSLHAVGTILAATVDSCSLNFCGRACIIFAFLILAGIRIGFFSHHIVFLEVCHTIDFVATAAAFVPVFLAIDDQLFRE